MPNTQLSDKVDALQQSINVIQAHAGRQTQWIQSLINQVPKYVDEKSYQASASTITLQPQSQNLERITAMIAYVSSTGAVLQVGTRYFPLPIGVTYWNNLTWMLDSTDIRSLTQSAQGQLSLELMGEEIPTKGPF